MLHRMYFFVLTVQLKHNLEQEVENMENEIDQLKARLERDSVFYETKMSDEENVPRNYAECETVVLEGTTSNEYVRHSDLLQEHSHNACESGWSFQRETDKNLSQVCEELTVKTSGIVNDVAADHDNLRSYTAFCEMSETDVVDQHEVVSDTVKDLIATCEAEDWPELSANTLKSCDTHDVMKQQPVSGSMTEDGGGLSAEDAQFDFEERTANMSTITDIQEMMSSFRHHVHNTSAAALLEVHGAEVTANESCIQLTNDQQTVCAVADPLDVIPASCDVSSDTDSCDGVIPDSDDDLFCSPQSRHSRDNDHSALKSHPDEPEHVDMVVFDDVCEGFVNIGGVASVESEAGSSKKDGYSSKEECSITKRASVSQSNQQNKICLRDESDSGVLKHCVSVHTEEHLSGSDETTDNALILCHQLSVIDEQIPKRPHWTFVVSGISHELDQVIFLTIDN